MLKPLGKRCYGSIPHLPNSRLGKADHRCSDGQARIATQKKRDKHDIVIVQEKLDGSNVGVAKINNEIIPLTRAGYVANTSPFKMHHIFHDWALKNKKRFNGLLDEGERVCGEWLLIAHGTKYKLPHEPFVAFDIMVNNTRMILETFNCAVRTFDFVQPKLISVGEPMNVEDAMKAVETSGHGAIDPVEGCVWRVERNAIKNKSTGERKKTVDYLVKYIRSDKIDGCYLDQEIENEVLVQW